jgi:quercetin dioxygenase-like cupin family protein
VDGVVRPSGSEPVAVIREGEPLPIVVGRGHAIAMVGRHTGARHRTINRVELTPGAATVPSHHAGEAVYLVAVGEADLELGDGTLHHMRARSIVYVPTAIPYRFLARTPVLLYGGPCPPDDGTAPELVTETAKGARVFDAEREGAPIPMISRQARLVVWSGTGAQVATMNYVILEPGEENQPHAHLDSEDTIVILEGHGSIEDLRSGRTLAFGPGDVVHVEAGVPHKVKADQGQRIVSAGGPCPPDVQLLRACGLIR